MKIKRAILPLFVILVALGLTVVLVKSRKVPEPHDTEYLGPLVEVAEMAKTSHQVIVKGTGTVQSRYEVNITPQVKGRINEISTQMVAGGTFRKGDLLFAIEDVDYQLAIDLARANLAKTELDMLRNENLAEVARAEWQALNSDDSAEPNPLVVYEPQLKSAKAQRDAAYANVKQAELNLKRTRVTAPFNCYVRSEKLDIGQFVSAGAPVATVVGTDQMEIVVPLSLDELGWLHLSGNGDAEDSPAKVVLRSGDKTFQWQGAITRTLGEIDPRSRMVSVVVTIDNPVSGEASESSLLSDLLPGMFVEVYLQGEIISDVIAIPRGAMHDNETVWVVNKENRLHIRSVDIVRRERDEVLVRAGVADGEKIVLSSLSGAAEGMLLRPQLREAK